MLLAQTETPPVTLPPLEEGERPLTNFLVDAGIDYDIRAMDRPSDHCPVWASFS